VLLLLAIDHYGSESEIDLERSVTNSGDISTIPFWPSLSVPPPELIFGIRIFVRLFVNPIFNCTREFAVNDNVNSHQYILPVERQNRKRRLL
jgi:hypothetical protein